MINLLSPCNQSSVLHEFLLSLYIVPGIFLAYVVITYFKAFADETISLIKKIYYIIWLLFYIIVINHVNLTDIYVKDTLGIPFSIWTLIIIFIIFLSAAYLLDLFILFGNGFKELSIFGAKFVKEDKEAISIQQKNTKLFLEKTKAANSILMGLRKYVTDNNFNQQIEGNKFHGLDELSQIIKKYYELQHLNVSVEAKILDNADNVFDELSCKHNISWIEKSKLKSSCKHSISYFIEQKNKELLFIPYTSDLYISNTGGNKNIIIIIEAEKNLLLEEQYTVMSIIMLYESEILDICHEIAHNN